MADETTDDLGVAEENREINPERPYRLASLIEPQTDDPWGVKLLQVTDPRTNKRNWLPLFFDDTEEEQVFKEVFRINEDTSDEVKLSDEESQRLKYCLETLNLPPILAVHAALNKPEISLEEFNPPESKIPSLIMSVFGMSGQGKSALLLYTSLKTDIPIFDLDPFSELGITHYREKAKEKGLGRGSSFGEIVSLVRSERGEKRQRSENANVGEGGKDLFSGLDKILEFYKSGKRPLLVLVDMPGLPQISSEGKLLKTRAFDAHDIAVKHSFLQSISMDESLDSVEEEWSPKILQFVELLRSEENLKEVQGDMDKLVNALS